MGDKSGDLPFIELTMLSRNKAMVWSDATLVFSFRNGLLVSFPFHFMNCQSINEA